MFLEQILVVLFQSTKSVAGRQDGRPDRGLEVEPETRHQGAKVEKEADGGRE